MNEHIMKILFGNQKQAMRQNEAIANFVANYMCSTSEEWSRLSTYEGALSSLESELNYLVRHGHPEEWKMADDLFVQYLLGMEAHAALKAGIECLFKSKTVKDSPKVVFMAVPSLYDNDVAEDYVELVKGLRDNENKYSSESDSMKALTAEEEAYALAHEMVEACPPSRRTTLPENEVLAAILFAKEYYAAEL